MARVTVYRTMVGVDTACFTLKNSRLHLQVAISLDCKCQYVATSSLDTARFTLTTQHRFHICKYFDKYHYVAK